ncbi:hypothetical protein WJ96_20190 [Burkholderia ubonensis]|uniref:Type VI secretion system lipoprotein TssJ n=1 Tax=Burkholderia ubonensis TaxID=101571 RepID=A0AAW3ML07_9BURK|nr:hypothetical protein WJ96_20190 [Burkholderia ubonensis]KWD49562.1 hypothetical protein WL66_20350 [Burkholderia ubonensis]KWD67993.1 hypothetical protein WL67_28495 [Burkholderia ubonensis]
MWFVAAATCASLAACGSAPARKEPVDLNLRIDASAHVNPDERGRPAPIMVRVYELKSTNDFDNADFFTLQNDGRKVLGDDALVTDEFVLRPGDTQTVRRRINASTTAIGVLAGYRDLGKSVWRAIYKLPPAPDDAWYRVFASGPKVRLKVSVGPQAVSVTELE